MQTLCVSLNGVSNAISLQNFDKQWKKVKRLQSMLDGFRLIEEFRGNIFEVDFGVKDEG
jgi:hypothetical protein